MKHQFSAALNMVYNPRALAPADIERVKGPYPVSPRTLSALRFLDWVTTASGDHSRPARWSCEALVNPTDAKVSYWGMNSSVSRQSFDCWNISRPLYFVAEGQADLASGTQEAGHVMYAGHMRTIQ
jgi:hypothetical protein